MAPSHVFTLLLGALAALLVVSCRAGDYTEARSAVYMLEGIHIQGSGVMIAPHRMLTVAHVIPEDKTPIFVNDEGVPVKVLKIDRVADIAILQVTQDCPCVNISPRQVNQDEDLINVGFPLNVMAQTQYVTLGRAQGVVVDNSGRWLMTDAMIAPGSSGGGTMISINGHWVLVGLSEAGAVQCSDRSTHENCSLVNFVNRSVDWKTIVDFIKGVI